MAAIFKLRQDTTDTALLSGTAKLLEGGYAMGDGAGGETFELVCDGTNAQIIAAAAGIDNLADAAERWFADLLEGSEVYFHVAADTETEKRALVYGISVKHVDREMSSSLLGSGWIFLIVDITRGPWESVTGGNASQDNVSAWGGTIDISAEESGNLPGRIYQLDVDGRNGGGGPLTKCWVGVRPKYLGVNAFDPVMELENGTLGTDAALGSESGASPNGSSVDNYVRVTFSTTTLAERLSIRLDQAFAAGYSAYVGEYIPLLRCRVSTGSTIGVQARYGMTASAAHAPNEELYDVTNTAWMLRNLGVFPVPPIGNRKLTQDASFYTLRNTELQIWAEVITSNGGTDYIDLDAVCLIPAKHAVYLNGGGVFYDAGAVNSVSVLTHPDDQTQALAYTAGVLDAAVEARGGGDTWKMPTDPGLLVFAGERAAGHVLTDAVDIQFLYYRRWRTFHA
jgi:hypothetical protein